MEIVYDILKQYSLILIIVLVVTLTRVFFTKKTKFEKVYPEISYVMSFFGLIVFLGVFTWLSMKDGLPFLEALVDSIPEMMIIILVLIIIPLIGAPFYNKIINYINNKRGLK